MEQTSNSSLAWMEQIDVLKINGDDDLRVISIIRQYNIR